MVVLIERATLAVHDIDGRHDHAGRAEAALQRVMLAEGLLHRVQVSPCASPSMVTTDAPSHCSASVVQLFTAALPST